ncbi:type II toxin-antitoxin system PemK/MazF family toxin [Frigoribacterium sp. PvP032]|uniref:type II toxin-antitoxin system PemK/MazF family toxin n=1 Tax=Frigoribacterium sp. PvP032 TaxID=2806589 RepID=UPI001AE13C20|nr:type II toxin-antitoxin system PemK/MazF family toxin [Frigoribacterium sp. PvP032]MBP1191023.1 mRNA interferase MazF [Frigoribacterium sp. PvP032]
MLTRGAVCWIDLGSPEGSAPAGRRPVVVVQADAFTRSALATVVVVALTSNTAVAEYPGNVFVPARASGLTKDSIVNVTQLATVDEAALSEPLGVLPSYLVDEVSAGLRLVLAV